MEDDQSARHPIRKQQPINVCFRR